MAHDRMVDSTTAALEVKLVAMWDRFGFSGRGIIGGASNLG